MKRNVQPELLDSLAPDDPRAQRSRRDLARINAIMLAPAILAAALRTLPQPKLLVDLGGGDARFLLKVARRTGWHGVRAVVADQQDIVNGQVRQAFNALGWSCQVLRGDIFATLPTLEPGAIITANLFLHHFQDEALRRLLALAATNASAFVACEPRRSAFALFASHLVGLIGGNDVTRHHAVASVRAGFTGRELTSLWPQGWACTEGPRFLLTHAFTASHV
jgi:hypothetical protein